MIAAQVEVWSVQCSKWSWYETHSMGKELVLSFIMGGSWIYFTYILYTALAVKIRKQSMPYFEGPKLPLISKCFLTVEIWLYLHLLQMSLCLQRSKPKSWLPLSLFWGYFHVDTWILLHDLAHSCRQPCLPTACSRCFFSFQFPVPALRGSSQIVLRLCSGSCWGNNLLEAAWLIVPSISLK